MKKKKITKDMSFAEILKEYPEAGETLLKKGMHCIGCAISMMETLEEGALVHGLNPDEIVKELNEKVVNKKIKKHK